MISPSALIADNSLIAPGAMIGAHVRIGPFCVISAGVEIGKGTTVASHSVINGLTRIGRDNVFGSFSSIGEAGQDLKYADEPTSLIIGDRNRIGHYATLHRGTVQGRQRTVIGNDNHLRDNVHVAHDCVIGNGAYVGEHSGLAGHVEMGDAAWVGARCAVHQFCIIGAHAKLPTVPCWCRICRPLFRPAAIAPNLTACIWQRRLFWPPIRNNSELFTLSTTCCITGRWRWRMYGKRLST